MGIDVVRWEAFFFLVLLKSQASPKSQIYDKVYDRQPYNFDSISFLAAKLTIFLNNDKPFQLESDG